MLSSTLRTAIPMAVKVEILGGGIIEQYLSLYFSALILQKTVKNQNMNSA